MAIAFASLMTLSTIIFALSLYSSRGANKKTITHVVEDNRTANFLAATGTSDARLNGLTQGMQGKQIAASRAVGE